jgi:hypothetical protein
MLMMKREEFSFLLFDTATVTRLAEAHGGSRRFEEDSIVGTHLKSAR